MKKLLLKVLPNVSLLGGLNDEELEKVGALLQTEHFSKGDVIAHKNDIANALFILAEGRVEVSMEVGDKRPPLVLAEMGPGACVGEMALIDMQPRGATVTALTDVTLYSLDNADFLKLYEWNSNTYTIILSNIARELSRRLRSSNKALVEFISSSNN